MYPIIPSLSKTWDAKSTKLCIQKIPRNLHRHFNKIYCSRPNQIYNYTLNISVTVIQIFRDDKNYTKLKVRYQINMPGSATTQAGVASFSLELRFNPMVGHVVLLMNDLVLGLVFLSCQFIPSPFSFHSCIICTRD